MNSATSRTYDERSTRVVGERTEGCHVLYIYIFNRGPPCILDMYTTCHIFFATGVGVRREQSGNLSLKIGSIRGDGSYHMTNGEKTYCLIREQINVILETKEYEEM